MSRTANTQTEFVTEIANAIGRRASSLAADQTTTYEDRIKQWLYWGHLRVARNFAFRELDAGPTDTTLTASTGQYTFTQLSLTRVRQIQSVTLVNGTSSQKLTFVHPRRFREDFPNPSADSTRQPGLYTTWGRTLELYPYPDDAYTLRLHFNQYPDDFASSSSASPYEQKDDLIVASGVYEAFMNLQEYEDAAEWYKRNFVPKFQEVLKYEAEPADWEPEGRGTDMAGRPSLEWWKSPLAFDNP